MTDAGKFDDSRFNGRVQLHLEVQSLSDIPAAAHGFDYDISHLKYLLTTTSGVPETPQWLYGPYDHTTRTYHAHAVFG